MILRRDVLAAEARRLIDSHEGWGSPHCIVTLHPDGDGGLRPGTRATVMPRTDPRDYPGLIARAAAGQHTKMPADPAYAYAFQGEFLGTQDPRPQAGVSQHDRYLQARAARTFRRQPAAAEMAMAWVADIYGRVWYCGKAREDGQVTERFYGPGAAGRGAIVTALTTAARITGTVAWGIAPHTNPN